MQRFLGIACLMLVLAAPKMVMGGSRILMQDGNSVSVSISAIADGPGFVTAAVKADSRIFEGYENTVVELVADAFATVTEDRAIAEAKIDGQAIATATAEAYATTVAKIQTSGSGSACASAFSSARAGAEAFASAFARAFAKASGEKGVTADSTVISEAVGRATTSAFADATLEACASGGESISVKVESVSKSTATIYAKVYAVAFAALFNDQSIADGVVESSVNIPTTAFQSTTITSSGGEDFSAGGGTGTGSTTGKRK